MKLTATFAKGLVVRTADQLVDPRSEALIAENADFRPPGSVRKSFGWDYLADLPETTARVVGHRQEEVFVLDTAADLHTYDQNRESWETRGQAPAGELTIEPLAAKQGSQDGGGAAVAAGLVLHAWVEVALVVAGVTYQIAYAVERLDDGAVVARGVLFTSITPQRQAIVAATDVGWVVTWDDTSPSLIRGAVIGVDDPTSFASFSLGSVAIGTVDRHDLAPYDPSRVISVRLTGAGPGAYTLQLISVFAEMPSTTTVMVSSYPFVSALTGRPRVARDVVGGRIVVTGVNIPGEMVIELHDDTSPTLAILDSLTILVSDVTYTAHAVRDSRLVVLIQVDDPAVPFAIRNKIFIREFDISAGTLAPVTTTWLYNAEISHQPTIDDGDTCWFWYQHPAETSQTTCYVLTTARTLIPHGRAYEGNRSNVERQTLPRLFMVGDEVWTGAMYRALAAPVAGRIDDVFLDLAIGLLRYTPQPDDTVVTEHRAISYWCTGGFLQAYDGQSIYEQGYHSLPEFGWEILEGAALPAGSYQAAVFYQSEDRHGRRYQSGAVPQPFTLAVDGNVQLLVHGAPATTRTDIALIGVITNTDDPSRFYVFTDPDVSIRPNPDGVVTIINDLTPAEYTLREVYNQLGAVPVLSNDPTPAARFVASEDDRLWTGDPEIADLLHYSIPWRDRDGLHFSPLSLLGARTGGEVATAVAYQDNSHYAFSRSAVSRWSGSGPSRQGQGVYSSVLALPTNTGTESQNFVAKLPLGVLFVSSQGPRLVARDQAAIAPFTAITELYEFAGQAPGHALYLPDVEQTLIFTPTQGGAVGPVAHPPRTLRLDNGSRRYSTEQHSEAISASASGAGQVVFVRSTGRVAKYSTTSYTRGGSDNGMVLSTGWMKPSIEGAFVVLRVGVLGRFLGTHELVVGIGYDYDDDLAQVYRMDPESDGLRTVPEWQGVASASWGVGEIPADPGNVAGAGGWGAGAPVAGGVAQWTRYQLRINLPSGSTPQCQAVRVLLWDSQSTGAPCAITSIVAEIAPATEAMLTLDTRAEYSS